MTTSPPSIRPSNMGVGLLYSKPGAWALVLVAFALGLIAGVCWSWRPAVPLAIATVAVLVAVVGFSRLRHTPPCRLRPLGLMQAFSVRLSGSTLTVGRSENCDVTLPLDTVSAEHCRVYRRHASWYVEDLGSRNGTRVNGKLIQAKRLRVGDTLSVADFDFRVC